MNSSKILPITALTSALALFGTNSLAASKKMCEKSEYLRKETIRSGDGKGGSIGPLAYWGMANCMDVAGYKDSSFDKKAREFLGSSKFTNDLRLYYDQRGFNKLETLQTPEDIATVVVQAKADGKLTSKEQEAWDYIKDYFPEGRPPITTADKTPSSTSNSTPKISAPPAGLPPALPDDVAKTQGESRLFDLNITSPTPQQTEAAQYLIKLGMSKFSISELMATIDLKKTGTAAPTQAQIKTRTDEIRSRAAFSPSAPKVSSPPTDLPPALPKDVSPTPTTPAAPTTRPPATPWEMRLFDLNLTNPTSEEKEASKYLSTQVGMPNFTIFELQATLALRQGGNQTPSQEEIKNKATEIINIK